MTELLQPIADTLGVSTSVVTTLLLVTLAIFTSSALWILTGSFTLGLLASGSIVIFGVFQGLLPLWVVFLGAFPVGYLLIGGVSNGQRTGMWVAVLIGIMIAIVVGVNLIPAITSSVEEAAIENPELEGTAAMGLLNVLPFIFVAVLLVGAVSWIGGDFGGSEEGRSKRRERVKAFLGNTKEVILRFQRASDSFSDYLNNLDELLGVKTVEAKDNSAVPGVLSLKGLYLNEANELWIDRSYDWYIADKHPDKDIFKVVGLHKEESKFNLVYLLGRNSEEEEPSLVSIPVKYLDASCEKCLNLGKVAV